MFAAFTLANHGYLSSNQTYQSKETTEQKLQILGYAHNQGAGGAAKWLRTGRVGKDGFGTAGTAYSDALARNFKSRVNPYPNQQIPSTPVQATPIPSSSPARGISTTVRDEINVAGPSGGTARVGLTPGQGYLARGGSLLSIGKQLTGLAGQPAQIAAPTPAQITSSGTQQRQQASQQLKQQKRSYYCCNRRRTTSTTTQGLCWWWRSDDDSHHN
jgi:hypothetical protein